MVAPITGPVTITNDWTSFYRRRVRYKQSKPYTLPLKYTLVIGENLAATGNLSDRHPSGHAEELFGSCMGSTLMNQARINAYAKWLGQLSDRASMAENLLQYEKSLQIIQKRGMQLFNFTKAIRRGNFVSAANILRSPEPRKRHPVSQSASNWLEFHLGVAPVVSDIYTAIDILQQPLKSFLVRAQASASGGLLNRYTSPAPYSVGLREWRATEIGVKYQAEVAVSNPNLYLANSLGIVNPAVVAWQMIPLSFVLDWFINVEQFLGTGSDLWGLTISNAFTTSKWSGTYLERWNTYNWVHSVRATGMVRELGIVTPSLGLRPYKATSWQRGLTAISLLVGSLKSLN